MSNLDRVFHKTQIIGFAGKAGSGKDAGLRALQSYSPNVIAMPIKFAQFIKQIGLMANPKWKAETHYEGALKEVLDTKYGYSPRTFLQRMGSALRELSKDRFIQISTHMALIELAAMMGVAETTPTAATLKMIADGSADKNNHDVYPFTSDANFIVFTDVRFQDEINMITQFGGTVYNINRVDGLADATMTDKSETQQLTSVTQLDNTGTLEEFIKLVQDTIAVPHVNKVKPYLRAINTLGRLHECKDVIPAEELAMLAANTSFVFEDKDTDIAFAKRLADTDLNVALGMIEDTLDVYDKLPDVVSYSVDTGFRDPEQFITKEAAEQFVSGYNTAVEFITNGDATEMVEITETIIPNG